MWQRCLLAALTLGLAGSVGTALELKNVRPSFGPLGATRTDVKCLPGDVLFVTYDIDGLEFDKKNGKAKYVTTLELLDAKSTVLFSKKTPNEAFPQLGGTRMPGEFFIEPGFKRAPGKYSLRLTVEDKLAKDTKSVLYPFEMLAPDFGMIRVAAPAVGFPGQQYAAGYILVDMKLDGKGQPNVFVMHRILDEKGETTVAQPVFFSFPKDLPDEVDLKKDNFHLMQFPIHLNRPGRFQIEVVAEDKNANKMIKLRYPLTVLDFTPPSK